MAQNLNLAELGAKMPFFCNIEKFIKFEHSDGFCPNLFPNVFEHWSLYKELLKTRSSIASNLQQSHSLKKIKNVTKSVSANQLWQKLYWRKGHWLYVHIKFQFDRLSSSWYTDVWIFRCLTHTRTHTHTSIRTFFLTHFSGRFIPFWVSWHENLECLFFILYS